VHLALWVDCCRLVNRFHERYFLAGVGWRTEPKWMVSNGTIKTVFLRVLCMSKLNQARNYGGQARQLTPQNFYASLYILKERWF